MNSIVDVADQHLGWPVFAVLLLTAFVLGREVTVRRAVNQRVDSVLRRETRFRHPATEAGRHHIAESVSVAPNKAYRDRITQIVDEALSEVDRRAERASTWTGEAPDRRRVCGKSVTTNLGIVACLGEPGHKGPC